MRRHLIGIDKADGNYSACSPDLPGCVATGRTPVATRRKMREGIKFHIEGLPANRQPVPEPQSTSAYVTIR